MGIIWIPGRVVLEKWKKTGSHRVYEAQPTVLPTVAAGGLRFADPPYHLKRFAFGRPT